MVPKYIPVILNASLYIHVVLLKASYAIYFEGGNIGVGYFEGGNIGV